MGTLPHAVRLEGVGRGSKPCGPWATLLHVHSFLHFFSATLQCPGLFLF